MTDETLRQLLARVHERLSSSSTIDPEARDMLATVMRDIDGALGTGAPSGVAAGKASPHRLEALAVRFEAEHPAIAQLLRQIGTLLGQAGI
jgi:predicted component of type VI protein secretion system